MERKAIQLPYTSLEGLSDRQIDQHFSVLYKGYVAKLTEIEDKLSKTDLSTANATYSEVRELQRERIFAADGIRLHEGYFKNLGGSGGAPTGPIADLINQDFESFENWKDQFRASGMSARGWAILAYDHEDKKCHNYMTDIHSDGVWNCTPLVILDVYEHAYFIDYGTNRKDYIETFFNNVNWDYVNSIIQKNNIMETRMAA